MRGIIFKGKRKDNGKWVEGDLILSENKKHFEELGKYSAFIKDNTDKDSLRSASRNYCDFRFIEIISKTIGEYTGKNDINKVKIFGNDIVTFDFQHMAINENLKGWLEYNEDELRWEINILNNSYYTCLSFNNNKMKNFEIIGNIYNKEAV